MTACNGWVWDESGQLWRKVKVTGRRFVRSSDQWSTFTSKLGCSAQIVMEGVKDRRGKDEGKVDSGAIAAPE
jgi:hypothetical protein